MTLCVTAAHPWRLFYLDKSTRKWGGIPQCGMQLPSDRPRVAVDASRTLKRALCRATSWLGSARVCSSGSVSNKPSFPTTDHYLVVVGSCIGSLDQIQYESLAHIVAKTQDPLAVQSGVPLLPVERSSARAWALLLVALPTPTAHYRTTRRGSGAFRPTCA